MSRKQLFASLFRELCRINTSRKVCLTGQQNSLDIDSIARRPAPEAKFQVSQTPGCLVHSGSNKGETGFRSYVQPGVVEEVSISRRTGLVIKKAVLQVKEPGREAGMIFAQPSRFIPIESGAGAAPGSPYPLMAPNWMPLTRCRWSIRKTRIMGKTESVTPAMSRLVCWSCSLLKNSSPIGSV